MTKKLKLAIMLCMVFVVLASVVVVSHAAVTATTAAIAITVTKDDGLATDASKITNFSSGSISVKNSAGETLDQGIDYSFSSNSNVYTVSNLAYADMYYVAFSSGSTTVSIGVDAKIATAAKTGKIKWSSSTNYTASKSGVIAGLVSASTASAYITTVKAITGTTTYETTSAAVTGAYKIYVPAGSYTLIVLGKDIGTDTNYKNVSATIKVTAGQASGPMTDTASETAFTTGESLNGLSGLAVGGSTTATAKTVTGTAAKNATVSVYVYENTNPVIYKYLGSKKVTATGTATTGAFSVTLSEYPSGKKFAIIAKDTAGNAYENTSYVASAVSAMTARLTADSTDATVVKAIDLTITEPTGVTGNFYKNITSITTTFNGTSVAVTTSAYATALLSTSTGGHATTGIAVTSYTKVAAKITLSAGTLATAQAYTIRVVATGYNDVYLTQTIGNSVTVAPATISGTFTVATGGGTASGSAKFSAIGTAGTGNTLVYKVTSSSSAQIFLGNVLTGYTVLAASTDITGVAATGYKYIDIVEMSTPQAKVIKVKRVTLTAAQIKVPEILSKTVSGTSLVMIANATLDTDAAAAAAFTVKSGAAGATANVVTTVAISGRKITITITDAVTSTQSVNIKYVVPTSNPLQDANANKIAAITAVANNVLNSGGGPTASSATCSATKVAVTMSEVVTGVGTLGNAFKVYVNGTAATVSSAAVEGDGLVVTVTISGTTIVSGDTVTVDGIPSSTDHMKDANNDKAPAFSSSVTNPL